MDNAAGTAGKSLAPPTFQLQAADPSPAVAQRQEDPGVSENVTEGVQEHLSLREGFRRRVYLDSRGLPTVGTGHLLVGAEKARYPVGATVPDWQLEQWRVQDSTNAYDAARQMAAEIDYESQELVDALTAVNFQLGTAWNDEHRRTWSYLENHDWVNAAHEAADSNWFKQTPVRVVDFQRVLLNIAGQPTDPDSLREFNRADIRKRGVAWPLATDINAFELGEHAAPGSEAGAGGASAEGGETTSAAPKADETVVAGLSGDVGLAKDGKTYVGNSDDIKRVQQHLINAGLLPAEVMSRSGNMVSSADGYLGNKTIAAINEFQSKIMGYSRTDGRIDMGGRSWAKLVTFNNTVEAPVAEEENVSGGTTTPETEVLPENEPAKAEETPVSASQTDEMEGNASANASDVAGPTSATANITFDQVPASYANQMKIGRAVGNGGANASSDVSRLRHLLQLCGYRTDLLRPTGNARTDARKLKVQTANCIFHFQLMHEGLSTDARVDPNGATWKAMVTQAFQNSGGQAMDRGARTELNNQRKGEASDVPSDIKANIRKGHLLGIDNSGYLLPEELHGGARILKAALEEIQKEIGGFEISCGYRSPEHNVKIGSNATKSQHVQGIAADIQSNGTYGPSGIRRKIRELIAAGRIPPGGIGYYSWGIHYDVRGSHVEW